MANGWDNWGKNHWGGWSHSYGPEPWSNDYGYKWTNKKASVYHHRKGMLINCPNNLLIANQQS